MGLGTKPLFVASCLAVVVALTAVAAAIGGFRAETAGDALPATESAVADRASGDLGVDRPAGYATGDVGADEGPTPEDQLRADGAQNAGPATASHSRGVV